MKHNHYNIESARDIFMEKGFILDEDKYINNVTKMKCHDAKGFKYSTTLDNLLGGKTPNKYSKFNPFTIDNIQFLLDNETDGVTIISNCYHNNAEKLQYQCSCGRLFEMTTSQFVSERKRYCNYCSKSKRYDGKTDYITLIKNKCEKLGYILLTDSINRSMDEIKYICNKHQDKGVQSTTPDRMLKQNQGCKYCGIESRGVKHRIPINQIKKLLNDKNFQYVNHDYIRYNNSSKRIRIHCVCKNHKDRGIQYLSYDNLKINKIGCIYCKGLGRTQESLQQEFDDANKNITILDFVNYANITVQCNLCGNVWNTKGVNINSGHGCPKCNMSNYEKRVELSLIHNNITYTTQYKFNDCRDKLPLPFDFYLPKLNILIEVDGQGHYMPINFNGASDEKSQKSYQKTVSHDKIKTQYCEFNNIKLIRIPYYDLDNKNINLDDYLLEKIHKIFNTHNY